MMITIKERRLLESKTIKKLQGWRILEKKMPNYVTIEGEFQSNRLYTCYFLMRTDDLFGHVNIGTVGNLPMDYYHFRCNDTDYVIIKVQSYNKIAMDAAIDHMRSLKSNDAVKFIRSNIALEFDGDSQDLESLIRFTEIEFIFD